MALLNIQRPQRCFVNIRACLEWSWRTSQGNYMSINCHYPIHHFTYLLPFVLALHLICYELKLLKMKLNLRTPKSQRDIYIPIIAAGSSTLRLLSATAQKSPESKKNAKIYPLSRLYCKQTLTSVARVIKAMAETSGIK